jgi:hypothetical protein
LTYADLLRKVSARFSKTARALLAGTLNSLVGGLARCDVVKAPGVIGLSNKVEKSVPNFLSRISDPNFDRISPGDTTAVAVGAYLEGGG